MVAVVTGAGLPARNTNSTSMRRLSAVVVMCLVALTGLSGCGLSHRDQPNGPAAGFPADHDAITVLASTATQVAIETHNGSCVYRSTAAVPCVSNAVRTAQFLRGDHNHNWCSRMALVSRSISCPRTPGSSASAGGWTPSAAPSGAGMAHQHVAGGARNHSFPARSGCRWGRPRRGMQPDRLGGVVSQNE